MTPILSANMSDMASTTQVGPASGTIAQASPRTPAKITPKPARAPAKKAAAVKLKKPGGRGLQNLITGVVAAVATGGSATGMWAFFGAVLHITIVWERAALFSVFELALLASALRARTSRIQQAEKAAADPTYQPKMTSVDDIAVWCLAALSGGLAASHETTWAARFGRMALPLVAAWLFERAIAAESGDHAPNRRSRINWRISPERLFVMLGLADASNNSLEDIERTKRIARVATLAYQAHTAKPGRRARRAADRYTKALTTANERYGLAGQPQLVAQVQAATALLFQGLDSTAPDVVAPASPWESSMQRHERRRPAVATAAAANPTTSRSSQPLVRAQIDANGRGKGTIAQSSGRRSAAERLAEYQELAASHPGRTQAWYADRMGFKDPRQLRNILKQDTGEQQLVGANTAT